MFEKVGARYCARLEFLLPFYRREWLHGQYWIVTPIDDLATITVDHGFYPPKHGIVGAQVGLLGAGIVNGDAAVWTRLELGARAYIFETAKFMRRNVPGFEDSYLHMISPYFHSRGGRGAKTAYALTQDDVREGRRFDDVVFVSYGSETMEGATEGNDFPYRQLVPLKIDGLLVAGRAAIIQPPVLRTRWKVFLMGQAAGVAASLAAKSDIQPHTIDVKALQLILARKYHAPLGGAERLEDLELGGPTA